MGIFDFFRRKNKHVEESVRVDVKIPQEFSAPKVGNAVGTLKEMDSMTALSVAKKFYAFDVETTGLSSRLDRIVELGIVEYIDGVPARTFGTLVNPGIPILATATAVNNITNEMLTAAPTEREVYPKLMDFMEDAFRTKTIVCAHNARFDIEFLCNTLSRLGYDANITYIDTLSISRKQIKGLPNYKLETVAEHFGIRNDDAHRAQSDAKICGCILTSLLKVRKKELELEQERLDAMIPSGDELEVCAVIQKAIEDAGIDDTYLRFKKQESYVAACCPWTMFKFKTARKGRYIVVMKSVAENCGLPLESCSVTEGGADWIRVYFNDPFTLKPMYGFFAEQYKRRFAETQEYASKDSVCQRQVEKLLCEGKLLGKDELDSLLEYARNRSYGELKVDVEKTVFREDVSVNAINNRCPLTDILNSDNPDDGFDKGSPYYWQGEENRKAGQQAKAIALYDKARYYGYDAPALYEAYAKTYRQMRDYDNEIVIIEEFLSRNTYGKEGEFVARRNAAIKLLFKKQQAERKAVEKAVEKEKKREMSEYRAEETPKKQAVRPILRMDDDGIILQRYDSISAASKEQGINSKSIRDAANGVQKHAGGYCWKYCDECGME